MTSEGGRTDYEHTEETETLPSRSSYGKWKNDRARSGFGRKMTC